MIRLEAIVRRIRRSIPQLGILALLPWTAALCPAAEDPQAPLADRIREYVAPAVESDTLFGLAIGVIDAGETPALTPSANAQGALAIDGVRVFTLGLGRARDDSDAPPDADTVFEIGSITKVFTGLALARLAEEGKVSVDDPVQKLLPKTVKVPSSGERQITLSDLVTQSSGLPRLPSNLRPKDLINPYADYKVEQLYEFLNGHKLARAPGEKYEYSNLGVGLLGHALALAAGKSYEQLITDEIATPIGMPHTRIVISGADRAKAATGHNSDGKPTSDWDLPTLAGAGALRSNVRDMLRFVAAEMGLLETPLAAAIRTTQESRLKTDVPSGSIGYAWQIMPGDVYWHNGGTGGYRSFIGFDRKNRVGVVVLANTADGVVDQIGFSILGMLQGQTPTPLPIQTPAKVDPAIYDTLAGKYQLAPGAMFVIRRDGDKLMGRLATQPEVQFFPTSETEYFLRVVDARITFEKNDDGTIARLILHQNGRDMPAKRVE